MQRYSFSITYVQGSKIFLADALSRAHPHHTGRPCQFEDVHCTEQTVFEASIESVIGVQEARLSPELLSSLQKATEADPVITTLKITIRKGWPERKADVQPELKVYFDIRDELVIEEELVFKGLRCVVPAVARQEALERIHAGHIGQEGCVCCSRERVYWPGMSSQIKDFVSRCETCQKFTRAQQKETFHRADLPKRPWQEVGVDLCTIQSHQYLVTVDYFSNFSEIDRLTSTVASEVIRCLRKLFAKYGIPDVVRSDNGQQFHCQEFTAFAQEWKFEHVTSSPGYPQANGKVENATRTVKELVRRANDTGQDPWLALLDFRNTPSQGIDSSPAQRLLGRRTRTTLVTHTSLLSPEWIPCQDQLEQQKDKQEYYYNRNSRDLKPLRAGDRVRVQPQKTTLSQVWESREIIKRISRRSYLVKVSNSQLRRNRRQLRYVEKDKDEVSASGDMEVTMSVDPEDGTSQGIRQGEEDTAEDQYRESTEPEEQ